ncbi:unnamed protein product [Chrysoparadoxa australica]
MLLTQTIEAFMLPTKGCTSFVPHLSSTNLASYSSRGLTFQTRTRQKRTQLYMQQREDDGFAKGAIAAFSGIVFLLVGFLPFLNAGPGNGGASTVTVQTEQGNKQTRGILTSLTRSEIQTKLSQMPVFFLRDADGAVWLEEGREGTFFGSPQDAKDKLAQLQSSGADVRGIRAAATTLDDVYYSLLVKKGQPEVPRAAGAGLKSDATASYKLVPSQPQVDAAAKLKGAWSKERGNNSGDIPLFIADKLAFRGKARLQIPLFTAVEDLITSWEKLEEGNANPSKPIIEVTSLNTVVLRMEQGGYDSRPLEFFPDVEALEQATKLF